MSALTLEVGLPTRLTASGQVGGQAGNRVCLLGFYVNSTTAGTIILRNGGSGGSQVSGTITPAVGFHRFPAEFTEGCYAEFGGTADITFFTGG